MSDGTRSPARNFTWTALRIMTGLTFITHGMRFLFGMFGGFGPDGGPAALMSRYGVAGVLEVFGGALFTLGLFTRPVAFLLSGQMAVAYFWIHVGGGGLWWWDNSGDKVILYCFIYLLFTAWGAGPHSVDAWREAGSE
jgi:putative oxidoreductase